MPGSVGRPIKHKTEEERHAAILASKRKWNAKKKLEAKLLKEHLGDSYEHIMARLREEARLISETNLSST